MPGLLIAAASNTLAPALAVLRQLGYKVSCVPGSPDLLQADNGQTRLVAEDTLQLLGLASIAAHRGTAWRPTDAEISDLLSLERQDEA